MKATTIYSNPLFTVSLCEVEPGSIDRAENLPNLVMVQKTDGDSTRYVYFDMRVAIMGESRITQELRARYPQWGASSAATYRQFLDCLFNDHPDFTPENFDLVSNRHAYTEAFNRLRLAGNDGQTEVRFSTGTTLFKASFNEIVLVVLTKPSVLEMVPAKNKLVVKIGERRHVAYFAKERTVHGNGSKLRKMLNGHGNLLELFMANLRKRLPELAPLVSFEPYIERFEWPVKLSAAAESVMMRFTGPALGGPDELPADGVDECVALGWVARDAHSKHYGLAFTDVGLDVFRKARRY